MSTISKLEEELKEKQLELEIAKTKLEIEKVKKTVVEEKVIIHRTSHQWETAPYQPYYWYSGNISYSNPMKVQNA